MEDILSLYILFIVILLSTPILIYLCIDTIIQGIKYIFSKIFDFSIFLWKYIKEISITIWEDYLVVGFKIIRDNIIYKIWDFIKDVFNFIINFIKKHGIL